MNIIKQKAFNERMGKKKFPRHQNLAKGGVVKMADGGFASSGARQAQPLSPTPAAPSPANTLTGPGNAGVTPVAATGAGQTGLIGTISNALGTQNEFQGAAANLTPGTNTAQLNTAYQGAQGALGTQTDLANTLAPQAGAAVSNQNALANQLLAMSQGGGPNPAQTELNTATGQNVAAQAALMAGQRGAGANAGLIARQAGQQGAATQQQAVGQAATLEAQQQIAAQQNLANLSNNQVTQAGNATGAASTAQQNEQNILQNANTSLNNADVSMQSNLNNVNSQSAIANQNMNANVASGVGKALSNVPVIGSIFEKGGEVKMGGGGPITPNPLVGGPAGATATWAPPQFSASNASSGPVVPGTPNAPEFQSNPVLFGNHGKGGGDSGALGTQAEDNPSASALMYDTPGQFGSSLMNAPDVGAPASAYMGSNADFAGSLLGSGGGSDLAAAAFLARGGKIAKGPHRSHVANFLAGGGETGERDIIVSPKEVILTPEQVHKVVHEDADPMKIGYRFPGKDKVKGRDSLKNDVIPTKARGGSVVVPIHITEHKDASAKSRKFVKRVAAKHMKKPVGV